MDDIFSGLAPSNGGEAPAPPAPEAPAPAAPEPPAPEATPPAVPTAEDADKADAEEWDKVVEDLFPGLDGKKEDDDEQTDAGKKPEETGADKNAAPKKDGDEAAGNDNAAGEGGEKKKSDDGTEDSGDQAGGETGPPELSPVDRQQLEIAVKTEVQQKMFTEEVNGKPVVTTPDGAKYFLDANGKPMLADSDGDPIKSIDDVMKLINPRTGEKFTEEQAGMWLLNAQSSMRDNVANMHERINDIASTGLSMKEESSAVEWEYGELLRAMPDLTKELWADYSKTLITDPKTGIVIKAPVSLKSFYERALQPYALLAQQLEGQPGTPAAPAAPAAPATPPAPDKAAEAAAKQQRRADRSDIYGGGKVDEATDDDKEWGAAAQAVFGDQLKDVRR